MIPYFEIACLVYSEQPGSKRQVCGSMALKYLWYAVINPSAQFTSLKRKAFFCLSSVGELIGCART